MVSRCDASSILCSRSGAKYDSQGQLAGASVANVANVFPHCGYADVGCVKEYSFCFSFSVFGCLGS